MKTTIQLTGQDMLNMGWEIENDRPIDQYELYIDNDETISAAILCNNGEYSDTGFTFNYEITMDDLRKHGFLNTQKPIMS